MTWDCLYGQPILGDGSPAGSSTLPFQFASSTCQVGAATSSVASVAAGYTYGEILSVIFLSLIFLLALWRTIWDLTHRTRIRA